MGFHFIQLLHQQRQDDHTQLAAQEFAGKLKPILEQYFPHAFKAFTKYM